jgi:hypothetical protein
MMFKLVVREGHTNVVEEVNAPSHIPALKQLIDGTYSLLDVGCGLCTLPTHFQTHVTIGLEVHRPYLENRKNHSPRLIPIHGDARKIGHYFLPKTMMIVLFHDVLEHFKKKDAIKILKQAETIAMQRVVIFVPRGEFPQKGVDHYGLGGEVYQEHRSSWEVEELLGLGYNVTIFKAFHSEKNIAFRHAFGPNHPPCDALLAWKDLSSHRRNA